MDRIEILNTRQEEAVSAFIDNNCIGTLNMATGTGKTITGFKCLYRMLDLGLIKLGDTIRFMAEVTTRKITLEEEVNKYKELTGKDVFNDFDIQFFCYAGQPDNIGQVIDIYDEIHDSLTAIYYKNLSDSNAKYKMGLSATVPQNLNVFRDKVENLSDGTSRGVYQDDYYTKSGEITDFITKGQMAEILCPIIYKYPLERAIEDGVLSSFESYIIDHEFDDNRPDFKIWKSYDQMGTERDYYMKREQRRVNFRTAKYQKRNFAMEMTRFLYNLPSKVEVVKAMLKLMGPEKKTIIFGVEKKILREITDNVCDDNNTEELVEKFNRGEINVIASSKKLKQGITLEGVENCILVSYYSKSHHLIQMLGRVVRFVPGKVGRLFIIRTRDSFESKRWFQGMQEIKDHKGKKEKAIDLNIKRYIDGRNIILKAKQHAI